MFPPGVLLLERFARPTLAIGLVASVVAGVLVAFALKNMLPVRAGTPPLAGIATSCLLIFALQAATFIFLGIESHADRGWNALFGWLKTALLGGAAFLGAGLSGALGDASRILLYVAIFGLGFCGLLSVLYALLALLFKRSALALQTVLLIAILLNSALFWSRDLIVGGAAGQASVAAQLLPDAVMKLSPPLAVASIWHESAEVSGTREEARFDLIRAPMTYDVWIGSYQAVAYPEIFPRRGDSEGPFQAGLLLTLLLWVVPLLWFCEVLAHRSRLYLSQK